MRACVVCERYHTCVLLYVRVHIYVCISGMSFANLPSMFIVAKTAPRRYDCILRERSIAIRILHRRFANVAFDVDTTIVFVIVVPQGGYTLSHRSRSSVLGITTLHPDLKLVASIILSMLLRLYLFFFLSVSAFPTTLFPTAHFY